MALEPNTNIFEDEKALKADLAGYLKREFESRTHLPVKVKHGEVQVENGYMADVVVEVAGEYMLAVETKNNGNARMAIGQAATYKAAGIPSAVALPGPLSSTIKRSITESGLMLFEYRGKNIHEHKALTVEYWEVLDRFETALFEDLDTVPFVFRPAHLDKYGTIAWKSKDTGMVHSDRKCAGRFARMVDVNDAEGNYCTKCVIID